MKLLITFSLSLFTCVMLSSQSKTFIASAEIPEISISGGSTLHDWVVTTSEVIDYPQELTIIDDLSIDTFSFRVGVRSMEGGRGATMDKKIYQALLANEHPYIAYKQEGAARKVSEDAAGKFQFISTGVVSIAGVEKSVEVTVNGYMDAGSLILEASHPLTMSAFSIKPPSAMFGQIQTKDDIVVNFKFVYIQK